MCCDANDIITNDFGLKHRHQCRLVGAGGEELFIKYNI